MTKKIFCLTLFVVVRASSSECVRNDTPYPTCRNPSVRPEWNLVHRHWRVAECDLPQAAANASAAYLAWRRVQATPREFGNLAFQQPLKILERRFQEFQKNLDSLSKSYDWTAFEIERERQLTLIKSWEDESEINHKFDRRYLHVRVQYYTMRLKKQALEVSKSFAKTRIDFLKTNCEEGKINQSPSPAVSTQ